MDEIEWLKTNGYVLFRQDGRFDFELLLQWSSQLPMPSYVIRSELDWPQIPYWGTPTFYFIKEGRVIQQIVGWPPEGRVKALLAALQSIIPEGN